MKKIYKTSLFIFRRDFRLDDNTGLIKALEFSQSVIPCFIFDPSQVEKQNEYRSLNCVEFMLNSLQELNESLIKQKSELLLFYGKSPEILKEILAAIEIEAVFVNRDYTPFSKARDEALKDLCIKKKVAFLSFNDALLQDPDIIRTTTGKPYTVFTAFFRKASALPVPNPHPNRHNNYLSSQLSCPSRISFDEILKKEWGTYHNANLFQKGGRTEAVRILKNMATFKNYEKTHDFPCIATTGLAAHNKFGTVSIREVYHTVQSILGTNLLLRQLFWRDFFIYIAYYYPSVFGHSFRQKFNAIEWSYNTHHFARWINGTTGFPLVDAGMRQLKQTGFMHNRVRMIVASFLTKDLHIDWRWGEKYFAQQLVDYDPAVNNGNWQWVASTGCDSQPYFRIFNPWLQQKKFDPECIYIKKWVPELQHIAPKIIHQWYKQKQSINGYPLPMLEHTIEAEKSKNYYRK